jgi:hypothetical protein
METTTTYIQSDLAHICIDGISDMLDYCHALGATFFFCFRFVFFRRPAHFKNLE